MNDSAETTNRQSQSSEFDLTTRARIRQAALVEFAEHGFRGASIRGIARAAGVSPGLVQHHFGTKDGLRASCDAYVMELLTTTQRDMVNQDAPPSPELMAGRMDELQPMIDYLITSLSSGSEAAADWFTRVTNYTHEALTSGRIGPPLDPSLDTRAIAATQAAMALGVTAFYRNIQHTLEVEDEAELMVRIGRARLFLASERVLDDRTRDQLTQALDTYERSKATGKPPPEPEKGNSSDE
jgi:AcrR family transcriptional regulator